MSLRMQISTTREQIEGVFLPNGKATKRWVVSKGLNAHWLRGNHLHNGGITGLDEFRCLLDGFTGTTVNLLQELGEFAGNVSSVAIEHWSVTSTNLARVIEDNDLGVEGISALGWVGLRVTGNVATTNFLDGDVLDVETNVVSWQTLGKLFVMHLDRLDFGSHPYG